MTSPGTPISPFTLGTPVSNTQGHARQMSGLGESLANANTGNAGNEAKGKEGEKEFLMGFLNGVVKGEGSRGGGR